MMDELLSVLDDAKIRFWSCRKCLDSGKRPCVDWINDTAICQICGNSNKLERAESAIALLNQEERKP